MAPKFISLVNIKGGCGKSTVTCMLALYYGEIKKKKVAVRDFDRSKLLTRFVNKYEHPNITLYSSKDLDSYDIVLIDTMAGIQSGDLDKIVETSDLVLIPLTPVPPDLIVADETAKLIKRQHKTRLLFNRVIPNSLDFKNRHRFVERIGIKELNSFLSRRVAYPHAFASGMKALSPACVKQVIQLGKEIDKCLNA